MSLQTMVYSRGNDLASVGHALKAIADLLGAGGSEHNLTPGQTNGLHHAILVMGELVSRAAIDLCDVAEPEAGGAQ